MNVIVQRTPGITMYLSADYQRQRHKLKLERLQNKVRKSEMARKELETKLRKMMKEREECGNSAAKNRQRSKYNDIFEEDQKRFNRNSDLLHLIDRIDGKAAALAARTERCKMLKLSYVDGMGNYAVLSFPAKLKAQHEQLLIRHWNQNFHRALAEQQSSIKVIPVADVTLLSAPQHHNPTQPNYIFKHHHPGASSVIITDGYANAASVAVGASATSAGDVGDNNNSAIAINNENNKQLNVIKYISSLNENPVVTDEMNLNIGPSAIHLYPSAGLMTSNSGAPAQFIYPHPQPMSCNMTDPQSALSAEHHNRIPMLSSVHGEQKAPIEQVFHYLQSNNDSNFAVHNAPLQPPTTATTTSIYTNFDGTWYAPNPGVVAVAATMPVASAPTQPHHQLMREFIIPSSHPIRSGLPPTDGHVRSNNDIAVQPHYQFNIRQPAYNKPFGSTVMTTTANAYTIDANSCGTSAGRPPGLRELLFGNKHSRMNDNANINELREKTDAFNNRLHEYAKFKEQQFGEHKAVSGDIYEVSQLRRLYDMDDGNEQLFNRPEDERGTSSMINKPNGITSGGTDYRSTITAALAPRLEDIPERDKVNENDDQSIVSGSSSAFDGRGKCDTATSLAASVNKSSFTLDPLFRNMALGKDDAGVAADEKTPTTTAGTGLGYVHTTPQRTLAFDLSKNATYPFERDENTAYLEDIDDDNRSEDSIEMVGKKIESLKLDETKIAEITVRKSSLVDSKPSSRRGSMQADPYLAGIETGLHSAGAFETLQRRRESISRSQTPSKEIPSYSTTAASDEKVNIENLPQQKSESNEPKLPEIEKSDSNIDVAHCEYVHDQADKSNQDDNIDYAANADQSHSALAENYNKNGEPVHVEYEASQQPQLQFNQEANYPNQQYEYDQSNYETNQQYYENPNVQYAESNQTEDQNAIYQTDDNYSGYQYNADVSYDQPNEQQNIFQSENEDNYQSDLTYGQQDSDYQPQDTNYSANTDANSGQQQQPSEEYGPSGEYEYQEQQPQENANYEQLNTQYDPQAYNSSTAYQQDDAHYQYSDTGYQQQPESDYAQESSNIQPQYNRDDYYSVEPGENYYNDNEQNATDMTYPNANVANADYYTDLTANVAGNAATNNTTVESNYSFSGQQQPQQPGDESSATTYSDNMAQSQHEQTPFMNVNNDVVGAGTVPNYLNSDAEESVTANSYPNQNQNDESDFDFSVKS